ncbi:hypothetical protein QL285_066296 [Trifolium repens]|nr:hypothetical protein QL285_066296 [Trifolium repens]
MDENIGRGRHGRDSRTHGSARREIPPAPKRTRRKKVQHAETGGSVSRISQSQVDEPVNDDVYDPSQYLDENADWLEQEQPEQAAQQPPEPEQQQPEPEQEPPETQEEIQPHEPQAQDGLYGGGPTDLSLLSLYHKHRAILIWNARPNDLLLKEAMRSIANGKKIVNIPKPDKDKLWFWDTLKATGLEPLCHTSFTLAYMQEYMDDASDAETSQMAGYLSLVQGWITEHFPTLGAWTYAENWNETMPRLAKYTAGQGGIASTWLGLLALGLSG